MIDIDRINELSRKSKTVEGLTPDEKIEQQKLRREYIDGVKASLQAQLDNTYIVDSDGVKRKIKRNAKNE